MNKPPFIEVRGISKRYMGVAAVQDVSLTVEAGEVHALLGENGAGKSTLTKMLAGVTPPSAGEILIDGQPVTFSSPAEALARGITMVFQENSLVPSMTVAQNLFLGEEKFFNRLRSLYIAAQQFLQQLNFNVNPWASVASLGVAQKQMVEIARAVRHNARLIIFDEPTASLTPAEKYLFFALVRRLTEQGVAIVFISHAIEESLDTSDRISILRDGKLVVTGPTSEFSREKIVSAMVGRLVAAFSAQRGRKPRPPGHKVLSVQNLSMGKMVRNTSFAVYSGQITGLFGLIGSGRTETVKVVAGVLKRDTFHGGDIHLGDRAVRYGSPRQAVRDGIVYVTEDRKVEGFFESMSIAENIGIGDLAARKPMPFRVRAGEMAAAAKQWVSRLAIRTINTEARVVELSGGNQQKVVIAKSLIQRPRIVILDEPTRGVDVGAIEEIHQSINRLAEEGIGVIVISSYLPEIMALSDRILVTRKGRIVEEFAADAVTEEEIMYAAVH